MSSFLHNPVWYALTTRDGSLGQAREGVAWFDEAVSPFAGFDEETMAPEEGFSRLARLLPEGRTILYARPEPMALPEGWTLLHHVEGVQMIQTGPAPALPRTSPVQPLGSAHVPRMVDLARRTKPGPFGDRTIEFGHYHGVLEGPQLAAMTGQRLHGPGYSEISAVCTDPAYLGKGYATLLVQHQAHLIREGGDTPMLHVRADNTRAIDVYLRLGFTVSRPMQFYFLRKSAYQVFSASADQLTT